ncbi:probable glutamine--tRNA ligase [Schistocerca serialis cubense]|uniref:probable glutamine--tRNA ligase n=1 Tax=Schistocerca serialis cubense TaxID=2023355 RepID=UPI00214F2B2B|nr:probable glutamine--tRNA ligase [Schistocerca serialis cubense]
MAESEALEEKKKTEDLYTVFHHMAEEEAMNCGRYPLSAKQIFLLQTLVSKYHIALQDHLALLTRYIGRGLIKNTVQLEAALVYLPHVARHSVNVEEFEQYCGIKSRRN